MTAPVALGYALVLVFCLGDNCRDEVEPTRYPTFEACNEIMVRFQMGPAVTADDGAKLDGMLCTLDDGNLGAMEQPR